MRDDIARLTRERDEARERERLARLVAEQQQERAESLSRELLDAMQARDCYRASAELRVGMRREFEELLDVGDTTAPETFEAGLVRLRALVAAEKAREEAAERLTLKRREYDIEVEVHAATKRERDSYIKGYEAAEARAARMKEALREVMEWIAAWDPRFVTDPEWDATQAKVDAALAEVGK